MIKALIDLEKNVKFSLTLKAQKGNLFTVGRGYFDRQMTFFFNPLVAKVNLLNLKIR